MGTSQTWLINGRHMNREQLEEYKKEQAAKRAVLNKQPEPEAPEPEAKPEPKAEAKVKKKTKKKAKPVSEPESKPNLEDGLPQNIGQLRALARSKGMEVSEETTKEQLIEFLNG